VCVCAVCVGVNGSGCGCLTMWQCGVGRQGVGQVGPDPISRTITHLTMVNHSKSREPSFLKFSDLAIQAKGHCHRLH